MDIKTEAEKAVEIIDSIKQHVLEVGNANVRVPPQNLLLDIYDRGWCKAYARNEDAAITTKKGIPVGVQEYSAMYWYDWGRNEESGWHPSRCKPHGVWNNEFAENSHILSVLPVIHLLIYYPRAPSFDKIQLPPVESGETDSSSSQFEQQCKGLDIVLNERKRWVDCCRNVRFMFVDCRRS